MTYCRSCESKDCTDQARCAASCCWCDEMATASETVNGWTDQACALHAAVYFAGSFASVSA